MRAGTVLSTENQYGFVFKTILRKCVCAIFVALGGHGSNLGTSVVRFNLIDTTGVWVTFDFALHESGHFDAITNKWLHLALVVTAAR